MDSKTLNLSLPFRKRRLLAICKDMQAHIEAQGTNTRKALNSKVKTMQGMILATEKTANELETALAKEQERSRLLELRISELEKELAGES